MLNVSRNAIASTMNIAFASCRYMLDYIPCVSVTDKEDFFPRKGIFIMIIGGNNMTF